MTEWENKVFDSLPFAGTSWAPETANENKGEFILGERPKSDGTSLLLEAFVEAVITRRQPERSRRGLLCKYALPVGRSGFTGRTGTILPR